MPCLDHLVEEQPGAAAEVHHIAGQALDLLEHRRVAEIGAVLALVQRVIVSLVGVHRCRLGERLLVQLLGRMQFTHQKITSPWYSGTMRISAA